MSKRDAHAASAAAHEDEDPVVIFDALSSPVRMRILQALAHPHLVSDLRIQAGRGGRILSRQTLQTHVDRLVRARLVRVIAVPRNGRVFRGYVVRPQSVRTAIGALRGLARDHAPRRATHATAHESDRAHLLLIRGPDEDIRISLLGLRGAHKPWAIGRSPSALVRIPDDPTVPAVAAHLEWTKLEFPVIKPAPRAAAAVRVNGSALERGPRLIRPGDVVTIGASHLLFSMH